MKSEEIAKLAGVSRSTVSRVLNNYPNVTRETRDKVMKIIYQHDYVPNLSAQVLAGKSVNVIGLFIIAIYEGKRNRIYDRSYFAPILDAVVDQANYVDSYVLVKTIYTKEDYAKIRQAYFQKLINSAIIVGTDRENTNIPELMELGIPMVVIGYDPKQLPQNTKRCRVGIVNSADYNGACQAMEYLVRLGHREIGILNGDRAAFSARERLRAYTDTMKKYGLTVRDEFILEGGYSDYGAPKLVEAMIRSGRIPTAIFCANDDMAVGAIKVFNQYGYAVPGDVSIVGFDDISIASLVIPPLTTVRVSVYQMAEEAIKCIKKLVENPKPASELAHVHAELVVRESCKKLNN